MARSLKKPLPPIISDGSPSLGSRLASLRKSKGLTQIELAERVGINQRLVSDYEVGRAGISAEMVIRLCQVLSISSDTLLAPHPVDQIPADEVVSLRLIRRLKRIQNLPANQQKALLQTIDLALEAAEGRISSTST